MYLKALQIAYNAHKGQIRKQSLVPYIVHPIRVANCFNSDDMKTIAVLHDVVEDTSVTLAQLSRLGFPIGVVSAIDSLSRRKNEQHFKYIKRLKGNEMAVQIKIADIVDNLSDTLAVCPKSMVDRYNKSLNILLN